MYAWATIAMRVVDETGLYIALLLLGVCACAVWGIVTLVVKEAHDNNKLVLSKSVHGVGRKGDGGVGGGRDGACSSRSYVFVFHTHTMMDDTRTHTHTHHLGWF